MRIIILRCRPSRISVREVAEFSYGENALRLYFIYIAKMPSNLILFCLFPFEVYMLFSREYFDDA